MAAAQAPASGSIHQSPVPAVVDQVGVAGDPRGDAGQGGRHRLQQRVAHPLGHAGQDEEVGRAEVIGGIGDPAGELDAPGESQRAGQLLELPAIVARPDQDQVGRRPAGDLRPGFQQQGDVLLGMQPAGEDRTRAGQQLGLDRAGARPEVVGVDAAGHPDQAAGGDAELAPLPLDLRRDRREGRVGQDEPAEQARRRACAAARRPRRNNPRWPAGRASGCLPSRRRAIPVATASQSPWCVWITSIAPRRRRKAPITPATKLRPNSGPSGLGLTQRWMKTPW